MSALDHAKYMRLAIAQAAQVPELPFGVVLGRIGRYPPSHSQIGLPIMAAKIYSSPISANPCGLRSVQSCPCLTRSPRQKMRTPRS